MPTNAEFFRVLPVDAALAVLFAHWLPTPPTETIPTADARDRVLAAAPLSPVDLPTFVRSAMDGYAVRAADTFGVTTALPAYLRVIDSVPMGAAPALTVGPGEAAAIATGAMLPAGADAVLMIEHTQAFGSNEIEALHAVAPGENLVKIGEDVTAGAPIVPAGTRLTPAAIGGLLAVGITTLTVIRPLRIGIVGSGDELVPPDVTPAPGQIRDINGPVLAALFRAWGADVIFGGAAPDDYTALRDLAASTLVGCDALVLTAGSSVSARDLTTAAIAALGTPGVLQHGLAVKPGKPTILAVCDGKPVIGLPGNPVSAYLVARQIVAPLIDRWYGGAARALRRAVTG